jgi:RecJ-like exonuclease
MRNLNFSWYDELEAAAAEAEADANAYVPAVDTSANVHARGKQSCVKCNGTGLFRQTDKCYRCAGKGYTHIGDRKRNAGYDRHRKGIPGRFNR